MTIRVLLADDHPLIRSGVSTELARHDDIDMIAEAVNGDEALHLAETLEPDVLLLDINMPGLKAVEVVRQLRRLSAPPKVLVLTAYGDLENALGMLKAGAIGYLLKDEDPSVIAEGIRIVARGRTWLSQAVAQQLVGRRMTEEGQPTAEALTKREWEVLKLLARGWHNQRISEEMGISERTVRYHLQNVYGKLGLDGRGEAIVWAVKRGLGVN